MQKGSAPVILLIGTVVIISAILVATQTNYLQNLFSKSGSTETASLVTKSPTPIPDPIPGWETYTNTSLGFSFQYPADYFKFKDDIPETGVYLAPSEGKGGKGPKFLESGDVWLDVGVSKALGTFSSYDEYFKSVPDTYSNASRVVVNVGGVNGYLLAYNSPIVDGTPTLYGYGVILLRNEILYYINLSAWNQAARDQNLFVYQKIISTFKFTN